MIATVPAAERWIAKRPPWAAATDETIASPCPRLPLARSRVATAVAIAPGRPAGGGGGAAPPSLTAIRRRSPKIEAETSTGGLPCSIALAKRKNRQVSTAAGTLAAMSKNGNGQGRQLPLDGYIRVSRVGGRSRRDGFISPDVQKEAIERWAKENETTVIVQEPELDRSGGTMDRPVFNQIMERIRQGQSGGIVVYRVDRFARSLLSALNTLAELGEHQAAFASCSERISYVTAQERAFLQMQFVFAELVRESIREGWETATRSAVERGIHIANNPPFGYDLGPERIYVPNDQAELVAEIFRRRAEGAGWRQLAQFLDKEAPRPAGKEGQKRRWSTSAVQRMIAKRAYLGEAFYGEHCNPKAHEPLVSEALFRSANEIRGVALTPREGKKPILLRGLLRCASCRYVLKEGYGTSKRNGRTKRWRVYRCNVRPVGGACPEAQSVLADAIEEFVVRAWKEEMRQLQIRAIPASAELSEAQAALAVTQGELDAFLSDLGGAARLRDVGRYESALEARIGAVEEAEQALAALSRGCFQVGGFDPTSWRWDVDAWWEEADFETRRRGLTASIDAVFVRGPGRSDLEKRVLILWRGQALTDLPRRGRDNGPTRSFTWPD